MSKFLLVYGNPTGKRAGVDLSDYNATEVESKVESDLYSKEESCVGSDNEESLDGDGKKTSKHDKDQYWF